MKKIIVLLFLWLGLQAAAHAQDVMVRRDGSEMNVKVVEITPGQVRYYRSDNQEGPVYVENRNRILKIKYANGTEDVFTEETVAQPPVIDSRKIRKVRYSGLVELTPYAGFGSSGTTHGSSGASITTAHGIQLMDKYFLGMGIGVNVESNGDLYVPVYTTFRLDLGQARARPFLSFSLGFQLGGFDYDAYYDTGYLAYGLWSNAMFGYLFGNKMYLAAGLTAQNAQVYVDDYYDADWYSRNIYEVFGFMLSLGVKF